MDTPLFKFMASTAASKRVSTVHPLPEQETTFHFRSESVPQDRDSPVFGLWVRSAAETLKAARTMLGIPDAGGNSATISPGGGAIIYSAWPSGAH